MEFNRDTVRKIAANARAAKEVWAGFENNRELCECFHLRPTASGITLVSTLPYAPMRGISVAIADLKPLLSEIVKKTDVLQGIDEDKALNLLEGWGYKSRKSGSFLEENAQALFIQGMILQQNMYNTISTGMCSSVNPGMYEGINFVASELVLADKSSRFDIVGYKDGTLYIFEMKKDRSIPGLAQTAGYAKLINENKQYYLDVLNNYPQCSVHDFDKVAPIAVMQYAANSTSLLIKRAKEAGVGLWFFERAITLRKAIT